MTATQHKIASLDQISAATPEYGDVLFLFRCIFAYIDTNNGESGITFSPDRTHLAEKMAGGFPLLGPEDMAVDVPRANDFLIGLLTLVEQESPEGAADLKRLVSALSEGKLDLPVLLAACLQRDRNIVETAAETNAVPAALLEFTLETVLKAALEPCAAGFSHDDFVGWQESFCPVCGSRAGMGELVGEEGRRYLSCCTCFFKWPSKRLQCPYCGNDDPQALSYFMVDEGPTRVDVCNKCSRYLKTRDSRKGHAEVPLEVEDLVTIHLDLVASREGFTGG